MSQSAYTIGVGATVDTFASAMSAGYRRFVMATANVAWNKSLDLNRWTTDRRLVIEASGPHLSQFNRSFANGPLLRATDPWNVTLRGLTFYGNRATYSNSSALVHLEQAHDCYFESCLFSGNDGPGLHLGQQSLVFTTTVSDTELVACRFFDNGGPGAQMVLAARVTALACTFQSNADYGMAVTGGLTGGATRIVGCDFNTVSGAHHGLYLDDQQASNVENCAFFDADLYFGSGTNRCIAERNIYLGPDADFIDHGTSNSSVGNVPGS